MSVAMEIDLKQLATACKQAARKVARLDAGSKNAALEAVAVHLIEDQDAILAANAQDVAAAKARGLSKAMVDRLVLTPARLAGIAEAVREVAALPDPVGEVTQMWTRPNGIEVGYRRIPLGVICMIYESRPNVTVDAAVLCLKAGNGIILRGGSEAFHSNTALADVLQKALASAGLPPAAVTLVPTTDRAAMNTLLTLEESIDLVIPRGGEGLIRYVSETSRIPVIKHYKGVCHLFVDEHADRNKAIDLLLDGKTSRPGVCNALETLLVHRTVAGDFLPGAAAALAVKGVQIRGCEETQALIPEAVAAQDEDYHAEFLDLIIAVKVVDDFEAAVAHIDHYGSGHTEVIATEHIGNGRRWLREVDASVVMVNASSRFSDGGQLGLGAEIGISTTKLHAYGPMGLESLTTRKFVVLGDGQVRG